MERTRTRDPVLLVLLCLCVLNRTWVMNPLLSAVLRPTHRAEQGSCMNQRTAGSLCSPPEGRSWQQNRLHKPGRVSFTLSTWSERRRGPVEPEPSSLSLITDSFPVTDSFCSGLVSLIAAGGFKGTVCLHKRSKCTSEQVFLSIFVLLVSGCQTQRGNCSLALASFNVQDSVSVAKLKILVFLQSVENRWKNMWGFFMQQHNHSRQNQTGPLHTATLINSKPIPEPCLHVSSAWKNKSHSFSLNIVCRHNCALQSQKLLQTSF